MEAQPEHPIEMVEDERDSFDYEKLTSPNFNIASLLSRLDSEVEIVNRG